MVGAAGSGTGRFPGARAGGTAAAGRRADRGRAGLGAARPAGARPRRRGLAPAAAGHHRRPARGFHPAGLATGAAALGEGCRRGGAAGAGAAHLRHPRTAGQPAGAVATEVGPRRPGLRLPAARDLPPHRAAAGRASRRSRAIHRPLHRATHCGAGADRDHRRPCRAAEAHLLDLAEDPAQGAGVRADQRHSCAPRAGRRRAELLRRARRRAWPVAAHPARIRRLHRAAQGQRLPIAAHLGGRAGGQDAGGADPDPRHARGQRAGGGRALALQGGRLG